MSAKILKFYLLLFLSHSLLFLANKEIFVFFYLYLVFCVAWSCLIFLFLFFFLCCSILPSNNDQTLKIGKLNKSLGLIVFFFSFFHFFSSFRSFLSCFFFILRNSTKILMEYGIPGMLLILGFQIISSFPFQYYSTTNFC